MIRCIAAWRTSYPDPIILRAGEAVALTGRADIWDGHRWLWAIAPDGKQGWVPDDLVQSGLATRDYSALELSCEAGEMLTVLEARHGWSGCQNAAGQRGWVPDRCLSNAADADRTGAAR